MTSYNFGLTKRKSKKKKLTDYNFYLKEASSSDSVGTESIISTCYDDDGDADKLDETFLDDSDEYGNVVVGGDDVPLTTNDNEKSLSNQPQHQPNYGKITKQETDVESETTLRTVSHASENNSEDMRSSFIQLEKSSSSDQKHEQKKSDKQNVNKTEEPEYLKRKEKEGNLLQQTRKEKPVEEQGKMERKNINNTKVETSENEVTETDNSSLWKGQVFFKKNTTQTNIFYTGITTQKTNSEQNMASSTTKDDVNSYNKHSVHSTNNTTADNDIRSTSVGDQFVSIASDETNSCEMKSLQETPVTLIKKANSSAATRNINQKEVNPILQTQQSYPVRADQFNKVHPVSPFDDVPGFRRSFSTSQPRQSIYSRDKERVQLYIKLSKSSSSVADTPKMLHSPVVVGRDKWIQFDDQTDLSNNMQLETTSQSEHQITLDESDSDMLLAAATTPSPEKNDWMSFEGSVKTTVSDSGISEKKNNSNLSTVCCEKTIDQFTTDNSIYIHGDEHIKEELKTPLEKQKANEKGGSLKKDKPLLTSAENLLEVVNKTVSLLKGSLTNRNDETKELVVEKCDNDDVFSELSDEVISLEFDTDEEKLCDTPVKQYTDVSLFQATTAATAAITKQNLRSNDNNDMDSVFEMNIENDLLNESVDQYPPEISQTSWKFWYRYPDKKRKFSSRKWLPVIINIEDDFLTINGSSKHSSDVVKEIPLHPFYVFTVPVLHKGNRDGKVHSVKLQYVKYKEKRRLKARFGVEHIPIYTPVVKLSSRDVMGLREFISQVEDIIRHIPTYRDKGITYTHEEIFIDSEDQCQYLISGDGKILKYNVTVQIRLRVFVTGNPELKLFLNDINNKEILSRTKEALLQDDRKPSNNWIAPEYYEYHPSVDVNKSAEEGGVVFIPPDGCSFELLRFRIRKRNPLPLVGASSLEVLALNSVHLKAEVRVNGDAKSVRHKRTNVVLYIPVPSSWSKLFLKSRKFGNTKNYIAAKTNKKFPQSAARASNLRVTLNVGIGSATYEPAYESIVWKIGTLPIIRDGVAADAPHAFECFIELPFPLQIHDEFQPYSYLEYNIAHQMGSDVSVEEVLLSDGRSPEKWVCYRSSYMHTIEMKIMEDGKERKSSSKSS